MAEPTPSLGFVGLGVMGLRMATNLGIKMPDSPLHIYDLSQEATAALKAKVPSVRVCSNSREVAEKANFIFTIVPEGSHVRSVYLTQDTGLIAADLNDKLIFEMSTIDTATTLAVRSAILEKYPNAAYYDAPVSGGDIGAEAATLTIMLGCAQDDPNFPRANKFLSTMGKDIIACGGPSLGLVCKLCNNYLSAIQTIANSEAFDMAIRSGMDPRLLQKILKTSSASNTNIQVMNPVPGLSPKAPPSNGYKGGFKVQYMVKDVSLAMKMARDVGAESALGNVTLGTYEAAARDPKCVGLDSKVVYRYLGGREDWKVDFPKESPV